MFMFNLQRFAHKKGVSSTRNGRDSESKRSLSSGRASTIVRSASTRLKRRCNRNTVPALPKGAQVLLYSSGISVGVNFGGVAVVPQVALMRSVFPKNDVKLRCDV